MGTTVVLDAARHAKVRRVIFAASSSAYGDTPTLPKIETMTPAPLSPYAVSKLTGEQLLTRLRVALRHRDAEPPLLQRVRPAPGSDEPVRRRHPELHHGRARSARAPPSSATASRRATSASSRTPSARTCSPPRRSNKLTGQVVNIACGERISLNQLLSHIGEEAGLQARAASTQPGRAGDVRDSLASIDAARALIGYEPKVNVREGLQRRSPRSRRCIREDHRIERP